jgi:hypothetical protein
VTIVNIVNVPVPVHRKPRAVFRPLFEKYSPCPLRQLTGRRHFTIATLSATRAHGTVKQRRPQAVSSQSINRI